MNIKKLDIDKGLVIALFITFGVMIMLVLMYQHELSKKRQMVEFRDRTIQTLKREAIERGFARHNPKTGTWEWVIDKE